MTTSRVLRCLGGEPFEPGNQKEVVKLMKKVRELYPDKDIWCYTGFTYETDLEGGVHTDVTDEMLSYIDVLVDGEFVEAKKDMRLKFRGSSNQRLLGLREMRTGKDGDAAGVTSAPKAEGAEKAGERDCEVKEPAPDGSVR